MGSRGKPHKVAIQKWANGIIEQEKKEWGGWPVRFAFKYFHVDHDKLCGNGMNSDLTKSMFEHLKRYEQKTWQQMHEEIAATHFHPVNFANASRHEYKIGFKEQLNPDMANLTPYQVAVSRKVRLFGVLYNGSFYVIWCDPNHHVFDEPY